MTSLTLYDILIISLIILVIFLIFCVIDLIRLIKGLQSVVKTNKQPLDKILANVSKLTDEGVTLEEKIKEYFTDLLKQFLNGKSKGEGK